PHHPPHSFPTRRSSDLGAHCRSCRGRLLSTHQPNRRANPEPPDKFPSRDRSRSTTQSRIVELESTNWWQFRFPTEENWTPSSGRSEEHTSELQSQSNLV